MQYDLQLTANGTQRIEAEGTFLKYRNGQGTIRVTTSRGAVFDLLPGQGVTGIQFSSLAIQDRSGTANVGVFLAGHFEFIDDTINGSMAVSGGNIAVTGKVSTVANNHSTSLAGGAFIATQNTTNVAGNENVVLLVNPGASGKNIIVESVVSTALAAGNCAVQFYLLPGVISVGNQSGSINSAVNVKVGGPAAVARTVTDWFAAGTVLTRYPAAMLLMQSAFMQQPNNAGQWPYSNVVFSRPVVLTPNSSLVVFAPNIQSSHCFEFLEE